MTTALARPCPGLTVRDSTDADTPAIQKIYEREVLELVASFEEVPPDVEELGARRARVLAMGLPYLVAERDGAVVGYSYASTYRPRPAYRHTVENSVYIADGIQGQGIGHALLSELIARCEAGPCRQMIAVIALGDNGASDASIALHERLGFRKAGFVEGVGYKFGRWIDSVLMQRALGPGNRVPPDAPGGVDAEE